jgi:hypothetical protein
VYGKQALSLARPFALTVAILDCRPASASVPFVRQLKVIVVPSERWFCPLGRPRFNLPDAILHIATK